jgi:hypothetical protein
MLPRTSTAASRRSKSMEALKVHISSSVTPV